MKVGDLVRSRGTNGIPQNEFGIIIADKGLSWQKDKTMWLVQWADGTWCILNECNLEVV